MRRFIRPATPEEEKLIQPHIAGNEMLLGVHKDHNVYAVRGPDGAVRYLDFAAVKPGVVRRVLRILGI